MRVALFSDTYPPQINGVATATYTLAKALEKNGDQVLVVTVAKEGQKKISFDEDGIFRLPGFTVKRLYKYKFAGIFSSKVFAALKKFGPDIIHVQTEVGIGIFGRIAAKRLNVPLVYTYHTMYEDYTYYVTKGFKPFDSFAKRMVAFFSTVVGDNTTEFVTTSNKTKDALKRYGVRKYINVVPNGLDLTSLDTVISKRIKSIKEKYDLNGKFTILILGRLAQEKNNEQVIKFLSDYINKKKCSDIKLLIVGDGPDREGLQKLVLKRKMDKFTSFVGSVSHEEVCDYYHASDLYVSASTTETQGLTYIESMASDLLVLAKFDYNLINVISDGKTGFFFHDETSFNKALDAIRVMPKEEKREIIKTAKKNVYDTFSLESFYERIMNVYKKALRRYW